MTRKKLSYYCFLAVLVFAPLAFGTVEAWSYAVMEILIGLSALLLFLPSRGAPLYRPPGLFLLLMIAGYLLFQVIPLPPGLVRVLSPEAWRIYHQTAGAIDGAAWMPLSLHPRATVLELMRFLSYLVFYAVAVQLLTDRVLLKRTLVVLAVMAGLLAFFVIVQLLTRYLNYPFPHEKVLWIRESVNGPRSVGPYVNRNHYAGLMEMLFPLVFIMFLLYRPISTAPGRLERLRDFFAHPRLNAHLLYGIAAILIGTSVFFTLSRGGILSLTLSMGVLSFWLIRRTTGKKTGLITAALFACILMLTGTEVWNLIFERFDQIRDAGGAISVGRLDRWPDHFRIIGDFFLFGTGLGTIQYIYPLYRTVPGHNLLEYVHNDYIGFMATGGAVLMVLLTVTLFRILLVSWRSWRGRHERTAIYIFAGCLTGILSILLHSLTDFNLQLGANGLYFFFILALAVSAAHTRFHGGSRPTYLPTVTVPKWLPGAAALIFFLLIARFQGGVLLANYYFSGYRNIPLTADLTNDDLRALHRAAARAAGADHWNAVYHHSAANSAALLDEPDLARHHYKRAIRRHPLKVSLLQDAGYFLFRRQAEGRGEGGDPGGPGERLLRAGIEFSRRDIGVYLNYAAALMEQDRIKEGREVLQSGLERYPAATDAGLALMAWFGLPAIEMERVLPEKAASYRALGDYLEAMGRTEEAAQAYQRAKSLP
ncbi:MAG: O-antigen ligase family protein [Desulfosudaceae bacterium]